MDILKYRNLHKQEDFDDLDVLVVFEDIETKKIVYKNKKFIEAVDAFANKKPNFDNRFITIDSFVGEVDGRQIVIEIGEVIVPITNVESNLAVRTAISEIESDKREEIHNDFLEFQIGRRKHDNILDNIVRRTIKFYQSNYAHLFIFDKNNNKNGTLYQYALDNNEEIVVGTEMARPAYWDNALTNFFQKGFSILCEDIEGFGTFDKELKQKFDERGIKVIVMIPFFAESELIGLLMLSNPRKDGNRPDLFLADYASNSIGTIIHRGSLYNNLYFDDITGFPWSNAIDVFYPEYIKQQKDLPIVIMQFDISHFRSVNRSYGVEQGNHILTTIAKILKRKYPNSLLSRKNGSDTFLVVTTGIAENLALEANNIIFEVRSEYPAIMLYLSFGIYQVKDKSEDLSLSMLKATFAHRVAKEDTLTKIRIYDEELDKKEQILQYYTNNFYPSIEEEKFEVYIQPCYNLQRQNYCGGEALVRWRLDGKLVPPNDFISLFETNGLCHELDLYVLEKVCKTLAKWQKESPEKMVPISINFSRVDFSDENLFEEIVFIIKNYQIPTKYIEIEITESAYVDYEAQIMTFLEKCHAAGIRILMDDFGSGVSSFNSLKNINIDVLKLDYKFLSASGDNKKKRKIIQSIVALARDIGIGVIVEGVETKDEVTFFTNLGIEFVQGYFFGKPMPIPEFENIMNLQAVFPEEIVSDSRFLLNELLDRKSNVHLMFTESASYMGIFRFDGKQMYPIYLNEIAEKNISMIGQTSNLMKNGLLEFVDDYVRDEAIKCLSAAKDLYKFTDQKKITFKFGLHSYRFNFCSMFIKEDKDYRYFVVQANPISNAEEEQVYRDYEKEAYWLLSSKSFGCVLLDLSNNVIEFNKLAKELYPEIEKGKNSKDIIHLQLDEMSKNHRLYSESKKVVCDVEYQNISFYGTEMKIVILTPLGNPNKYIAELADGGFKCYDRALSTVDRIAIYYTEVDLSTDKFMQMNFHKVDVLNDDCLLRTGKYSDDYLEHFMKVISKDDRIRVEKKMTLEALNEASKSMSPFKLTYKISGQKIFFRINVKFYHDNGHFYACFYTEDITEMKLKDYDILTGCMSRNGGINFINNYFKEHPLEKMVFIVVDLDKFKTLNDTYGHPLGDRVLTRMHSSFKKLPPEFGNSTRLGGDEFCLLLKKRDADFDKEKVREQIDDVIKVIGKEVGLGMETHCSCGFAMFPEEGSDVDSLYSVADKDLYIHKARKGKVN